MGKFNQSSLKDVKHDAYHLIFYSSHGYGKSIRFSKKGEVFQLSMKCIGDEGWNDECEEYQNTIDEEEWQELEKMIYEYDFWTAQHFRSNQNVLDGYILILEGVRTGAADCNIDTHKLVARGSPQYDKIGDLCHNIIDYEQTLRMRYEDRIR